MLETDNTNYLLTFARKWRHRGGGSGEDILVEFGLSQREYFRKLLSLLDQRIGAAADLPLPIRQQLTQICHLRLRDRRAQRGQDRTI
ncbi:MULTISPECIES: DUF3263 domain-containing protein [Rhodococcus]|uniref:DUF3263 domain-containing protein n=1 Tax=Rhodococcus TaxID=1827 RepID=UPI0002A2BF58|nr:DUF3263 domain-containing protein [Rhodococcus opacus]ELB90560.1 hypothetical protein Rwratislav_24064 [Rhodococcus wratislaviensis IFP 2016]NHU47023.1 DUF3263 domain-containing protein [Rhodococcus sp. A14]MBA8961351.1 hypothetical protein [Rhodococcus opacus]MBP2202785.1 hypothetical protein [Rhodococcus opacus]MDJ0415640.1 DUF3263 domain-containing protein [Rhodococcus opacus]